MSFSVTCCAATECLHCCTPAELVRVARASAQKALSIRTAMGVVPQGTFNWFARMPSRA